MLEHSRAVFNGCCFGEALEDPAEIGSITKAASDGDVFQFEIIIAQQEFAPRNAHVGQIRFSASGAGDSCTSRCTHWMRALASSEKAAEGSFTECSSSIASRI
jgi:hypothetical protein